MRDHSRFFNEDEGSSSTARLHDLSWQRGLSPHRHSPFSVPDSEDEDLMGGAGTGRVNNSSGGSDCYWDNFDDADIAEADLVASLDQTEKVASGASSDSVLSGERTMGGEPEPEPGENLPTSDSYQTHSQLLVHDITALQFADLCVICVVIDVRYDTDLYPLSSSLTFPNVHTPDANGAIIQTFTGIQSSPFIWATNVTARQWEHILLLRTILNYFLSGLAGCQYPRFHRCSWPVGSIQCRDEP